MEGEGGGINQGWVLLEYREGRRSKGVESICKGTILTMDFSPNLVVVGSEVMSS